MEEFRSSRVDFLQAQLNVANAQNAQLSEENDTLRHKLQRFTNDSSSSATVNVENKLKAFQFEDERDRMYEKLEKNKRKYNQLHEAYLQKVKRCKALEDVFSRQKTLNGLVMKSAMDQRQQEQEVMMAKRRSENIEQSSIEALEGKVKTLQTALDEAYDNIDELEFELESVDFLEMENQRLQNELETYKKKKPQLRSATYRGHMKEAEIHETAEENTDEENAAEEGGGADGSEEANENLPEYTELEGASTYQTDSNSSSLADSFVGDMDAETLERSALTESLIKTAEAESNCLRRELLRSRLQRTLRPTVRPTSTLSTDA